MQGFIAIAQYVETTRGVRIRDAIVRDLANYSFGLLSVQRKQPLHTFIKFAWDLGRLGYGKYPMYWFSTLCLIIVPERMLWWMMAVVKRVLGRTPNIGGVYEGTATSSPGPRE
jgi:hypothetical protein